MTRDDGWQGFFPMRWSDSSSFVFLSNVRLALFLWWVLIVFISHPCPNELRSTGESSDWMKAEASGKEVIDLVIHTAVPGVVTWACSVYVHLETVKMELLLPHEHVQKPKKKWRYFFTWGHTKWKSLLQIHSLQLQLTQICLHCIFVISSRVSIIPKLHENKLSLWNDAPLASPLKLPFPLLFIRLLLTFFFYTCSKML